MNHLLSMFFAVTVCLAPWSDAAAEDAAPSEVDEEKVDAPKTTYNTPIRDGLTAQFGFGLSYVLDNPPEATSSHGIGIWPGSFGLGYFMSKDVAVVAHASGSSYISEIDDDLAQTTTTYLGFGVQWWPTDEFTVETGGGSATYSVGNADHLDLERTDELSRSGWALTLRGGYAFGVWQSTALRLNLEVIPAFFGGEVTLGTNLGFELQTF